MPSQPPGNLFTHRVDFDPAAEFEAFRKSVPARWAVYLMADEQDRPVQLLCVKNLRYSLERRLGAGEPQAGPSKRVNYREVVRRVYWRLVDSAFEADAVYLEIARQVFPQTYQGMVGFRPAWFVNVNPDATFPRYTKTTDLGMSTGTYIGPVEDKQSAGKLIEQVEDWFDLCRYYNVLVEAPRGRACAYKEMGKCPAPCDGTIGMDQYRRLVEMSLATLVDPAFTIREHEQRMAAAAKELKFETAAKIKQYVDSLGQLGKGSYRYARPMKEFNFLSLQRGPREGTAKVFLITPGKIDEILGLPLEPIRPADVLRVAFALGQERAATAVDPVGAERIGVVAHHLFLAKSTHGVFLPLDKVDEKSLVKAYRDLLKQKPQETAEGEGVMKELQAL